VPIIAAIGGVLLLSEQITFRLLLAGFLIIGGVGLTLMRKETKFEKMKRYTKYFTVHLETALTVNCLMFLMHATF
jgi:hypothetical protein